MSEDEYYISPHETALAVVATAMKKARLTLTTLALNSLAGGVLFSTGGLLYTSWHGSNQGILENDPGVLNFLGAFTFSIGLFYVVINGTDLFNSNILFFSVAFLRGAVSIYDLLISWTVSWIGNFTGTLFVVYVMCHLSGTTRSADLVSFTRQMVAKKDSSTFVQTFIKGIAGNFYVSLAIYLQLMAKPLHVKYLMMTLPIFTFVAAGFTHVVAEMFLLMVGMLNGADLSVGTFVWKHMVAVTLGNMIGGSAFALVIPYYLHLVVVEQDRKRLALPSYEARDEQPEINMDSRVVRIPTKEAEEVEEEAEENEELTSEEKANQDLASSDSSAEDRKAAPPVEYRPRLSSTSLSRTFSNLRRVSTSRSYSSMRSVNSLPHRTPVGVFPVKGMASPVRTNSGISSKSRRSNSRENSQGPGRLSRAASRRSSQSSSLQLSKILGPSRRNSVSAFPRPSENVAHRSKSLPHMGLGHESPQHRTRDVLEDKMGTKLERALTRITSRVSREGRNSPGFGLPSTTQDIFPTNTRLRPQETNATASFLMDDRSSSSMLDGTPTSRTRSRTPSMRKTSIQDLYLKPSPSEGLLGVKSAAPGDGSPSTEFQQEGQPGSGPPQKSTSSRSVPTIRRPSSIYVPDAVDQRNSIYNTGYKNTLLRNHITPDNDYDEEQSIEDA
ncbi:LAQU0S01e09670g1_1 [Lachancea quebecensis]|uniref:LAQU0S01e09670g1_1 n=1 Tax=Lachancea quebecensis TaxID=1654605 RepID=A0A0P1KMF4_9SACH|nr:LAQU0S01e09670g1_1 [Lachancea quebecensis]